MLKKAFAPLFLTSIFVIAGCSSDEASKDLENVDEIEVNDADKQSKGSESSSNNTESEKKDDSTSDTSTDQNKEKSTDKTEEKSTNQTSDSKNQSNKDSTKSTEGSGSGGSKQGQENQESNVSESSDKDEAPSSQQYTFSEVNGEAVNVLQGVNAVEIKRENISGATANTQVVLKVEGKKVSLDYNKNRDSFRNYQIKDVALEKLKKATVVVKG